MRHDLIAGTRLAGVAAAVLTLAACSSWMDGSQHSGSTAVAPAITGANSSTTTKGPPGSGDAPNPPTAVAEPSPH
ncbi:hypothetical protein [Phenylobacterium sp.]|uniref:hypothetical protein n=1 Tax=Phenylobacterium sp. TaxID=1871053 RepID=UPI002CC221AB|nr:hypothetical protein [Phenylobacterium sp.]HLZ74353.1 hypothetical protein [Phenylobacterium sp.]